MVKTALINEPRIISNRSVRSVFLTQIQIEAMCALIESKSKYTAETVDVRYEISIFCINFV